MILLIEAHDRLAPAVLARLSTLLSLYRTFCYPPSQLYAYFYDVEFGYRPCEKNDLFLGTKSKKQPRKNLGKIQQNFRMPFGAAEENTPLS